MKKTYTEYFQIINDHKKLGLSEDDIKYMVDVAIASTKGARNFDLLKSTYSNSIRDQIVSTPILILGGSEDKLVTPDQLKTLFFKLDGQHGRTQAPQLKMISNAKANHLFVQTLPEVVFKDSFQFLNTLP